MAIIKTWFCDSCNAEKKSEPRPSGWLTVYEIQYVSAGGDGVNNLIGEIDLCGACSSVFKQRTTSVIVQGIVEIKKEEKKSGKTNVRPKPVRAAKKAKASATK